MKRVISVLMLAVLVCLAVLPVFASTVTNQVIFLPANQVWKMAGGVTRTMIVNYVGGRVHSVYPDSGVDTFLKCQCKITNPAGTRICNSSYITLWETASDYTDIYIEEGYLDTTKVYFWFRGAKSSEANAVVSYTGN